MLTPTGQLNHPAGAPRRAANEISEVRVRVLHLNAGNLYGGVETLLATLAKSRQLCPGMEPHFAMCYEGRSSREIQATGAAFHLLGPARISRPWTVWRVRRRLRELLRKERFDMVVCHMDWTLLVFGAAARAAGHKVTLWAHGFQTRPNWLEPMAPRIRPDLVITNSRFTAARVRPRFPNQSVPVIYYPVAPPADFRTAAEWRAATRREQGVDESTTVILQVGRLDAWKGYLTHLQALAKLKPERNWVCWIAGGPQTEEQEQYFRQLQETVARLGIRERVRFLGQRTDVPQLMAAADIFCQPNLEPEPFGLVFVEALWAGLPVITSDIGGAVEIVDESCGLLVKPGDAGSLAQSLDALIESPGLRARFGRAGVERARSLCDPASQMKKIEELMQAEIRPRLPKGAA
jgi:glycosyltransferase involved in cell wall biosynthesis